MKKRTVELSTKDKEYLEDLLSKGSLPVRTYKRATALLDLDRGRLQKDVSASIGISVTTISKWCSSYRGEGLRFLYDEPRSGRPREITGQERARITALACSEPPGGYAKWSLRLLADKAVELGYVEQVSHTEVGKILKKTNSNPQMKTNCENT